MENDQRITGLAFQGSSMQEDPTQLWQSSVESEMSVSTSTSIEPSLTMDSRLSDSSQISGSVQAPVTPYSPVLQTPPSIPIDEFTYNSYASWWPQEPLTLFEPSVYNYSDQTQAFLSNLDQNVSYNSPVSDSPASSTLATFIPQTTIFTLSTIGGYEGDPEGVLPPINVHNRPTMSRASSLPPVENSSSTSGNSLVHRIGRASSTSRLIPYFSGLTAPSPSISGLSTDDGLVKSRRAKVYAGDIQEDGLVREHTCEFCNQMFVRKEHLKRHVRCVHQEIKSYQCPTCGKRCSRGDNLKQHMKIHISSPQNMFQFIDMNGDAT